MATYKEINGTNIEILSSDPTNPLLGQIWYNSTTNTLKGLGFIATSSWATGGTMGTGRDQTTGAGSKNAALAFGGGYPAKYWKKKCVWFWNTNSSNLCRRT